MLNRQNWAFLLNKDIHECTYEKTSAKYSYIFLFVRGKIALLCQFLQGYNFVKSITDNISNSVNQKQDK